MKMRTAKMTPEMTERTGAAQSGIREGAAADEWAIGGVQIRGRAVLAPMAGVSDLPFRLLCREQGAAYTVMEMVSAKAVCYRNEKTWDLVRTVPEEGTVALQLFGHEPEVFAEAAELLSGCRFDILDVNMGCPMPKITGNGEGSALMRDPALIERIVRALCAHTDRPVTVKLRKAYDDGHVNAVECALAARAGGACAVAVHGRTRRQLYGGRADWDVIRQVREALDIPVIGNGDVTDGESARRLLEETGCTAVMVGRAAQGDPWIFREINAALAGEEVPPRPSRREIRETILRQARMLCLCHPEGNAMRQMRKQVSWYLSGFPGAARLRGAVNEVTALTDLERLLAENLADPDGTVSG